MAGYGQPCRDHTMIKLRKFLQTLQGLKTHMPSEDKWVAGQEWGLKWEDRNDNVLTEGIQIQNLEKFWQTMTKQRNK